MKSMAQLDKKSVEGIPVLLLKTKSTPNDGYEELLSSVPEGASFRPLFVPVLEHQLWEDGMSTVRGLLQGKHVSNATDSKYGGLIFTSQRAVEAFAKLVHEGAGDSSWPHLQNIPIYTVGPATSRALRSIPQTPPLSIFGAETGNGEALAYYMLDHYGQWYSSLEIKPPLLFLVGDQRRDIIPKTLMDPSLAENRRIQVDELVVYGTGEMESFEQDFTRILEETEHDPIRWVVVFSPTGCKAMLQAMNLLDSTKGKCKKNYKPEGSGITYIATIGPTTRDYLRKNFEYEPDVCAAKPNPEGIKDGIRAFMDTRTASSNMS